MINVIFDKLKKTRDYLREQLSRFNEIDESILNELEATFIQADLGVEVSNIILKEIRKRNALKEDDIFVITRDVLYEMLKKNIKKCKINKNPDGLTVILVLGVNGTGKTTAIAKLAYRFKQEGKKVLLAAGDTFRAAAIEQLELWAYRAGVDVIKHSYKADPSAVSYDALKAALSRKMDYLIIDTAGRFHTKTDLIDELKKIEKTLSKNYAGAPHERLLVIDATTGQNAIMQARQFNDAVNLTGIIVTKLDGTAKGGVVVNIQNELGIPVKFIGIGQELTDLREFDPEAYAKAII